MHNKYINKINKLSDEALANFNASYEKFRGARDALRVNLEEFPRGTTLPLKGKPGLEGLEKANKYILEANKQMDETLGGITLGDQVYDDKAKEINKKHNTLLDNLPDTRGGLGASLVMILVGLAFVGFYIINTFVKTIYEFPVVYISWAIVGVGVVLALIGFLTLIFYSVSAFNHKAELDDRKDILDDLKKEEEALIVDMDGLAFTYENALRSLVVIEDEAFGKIKTIPERGESLYEIRSFLGVAANYIATERADTIADVFKLVEEEKRHRELLNRLTWNKKYLETIIKEIRNSNKISIAAMTNGDIYVD